MVEYNGVWQAVSVREGTLYYCMEIGEQLMAVDNNKNGYGGRVFELTLADGSTTQIKGPWSSRPDQVRRYGNVNFVGKGEEYLDDGIVLFDPSGEINTWATVYEYDGLFLHEYSFLCDENEMWHIDSMKTEQLFDEETD